MFPQQTQPQQPQGFNPYNTAAAASIASSIGNSLMNAKPATFGAPMPSPLSAPQQPGINFGSLQMGQVARPSGFQIAVPQTIPSAALKSTTTASGLMQARDNYQAAQSYAPTPATPPIVNPNAPLAPTVTGQPAAPANPYAQYAQQLASAEGYSPNYLSALKATQDADAQKAQLTSNYYTGANLPGDTQGYAQGFTTRESALNDISGLRANQALQVQTLIRQGNISAATSLMNAYAPTSVSPGSSLVSPVTGQETYSGLGGYQAVQGIQTVNNLAQAHPDAGIVPTDNLVTAAQKVSQSPSFQAGNLIAYATPSGGIGYINKLNINQLQRNTDGTYQLLGNADAAGQSAAKGAIADLTKQRADTQAAITTADQNFPLLLDAAKAANLNNNAPLVNEINQKIANKASQSTALATLNTLVPSLQAEYSRIIARGGTVDDKTRTSAQAIVSGSYSLAQLQAVYNTVQKEGKNVIKGFDDEIKAQSASLGGQSTSSGGGGLYDF